MAADLPTGISLQRVEGWYSQSATTSEAVLEHAFTQGKQIYKNLLSEDQHSNAWTGSRTSIEDVIQAVNTARDIYAARRSSKAWKWLTQFSVRITHYSAILDVMVEHHPEYAALAWGAMKLLFVGVTNHEESVHQLSKALHRFSDCLPRHELKLVLYPSIQMQEAVAKLYAHMMNFMMHAIHWYQKGRTRRAIGAIFKPFELDFQDNLTEAEEISRNVDEIANAAAQAELRAVHTKVEDASNELGIARLEIQRLSDLVSFQNERIFQVASCAQTLSSQIQMDVRAQTTMIRTVQLNQIMSAPFMADVPSSGQSLSFCSTFIRRRPENIILAQPEIENLRRCSLDIDVSYLIMETQTPNESKSLLLNLLQQVQAAQRPIIWALRSSDFQNRSPCLEDIIRILVLHALEINSNALTSTAFPITLPSLRAAASQSDWLSTLNRSLYGLPEVYIIIDPDLLRFVAENNSCSAADLILALKQGVIGTRLKIILSSVGINKEYFTQHATAGSWKVIRTKTLQAQRLAKMKKQHLARVRRNRK